MTAYDFTENEIHGIYYLASIGFAHLMKSSSANDPNKMKDAEIIRLSSINGLQALGDEGFNDVLKKLDDLRVAFFGEEDTTESGATE
jgi:hypothetical protein